jgi:3-oxoadipate enol-lactonase
MTAAYSPDLPPGREITLPGRGTTFVREAPGPPGSPTVLLLHGWTVTADVNWFKCYGPLSRRFNVVAMDHRGHGRGIRSIRPFRLEDCADDAAALVRHLDQGPVIPVGYSMGGTVARLLSRRHPDAVSGLVLCATSRTFASRRPSSRALFAGMLGLSAAARLTPAALRRQAVDLFLARRMGPATPLSEWILDQTRSNDPAAVLQAGYAIGRYSSKEWIGELEIPAAVVVTEQDQVVLPRYQRELAAAIPGATVHPVAADHGAAVTSSRRFLSALLAAVDSVVQRQAVSQPPVR